MTLPANTDIISRYVCSGTTLLDIGCGDGALMAWLAQQKQMRVYGIERETKTVQAAIAKGLAVVQGDAEEAIMHYADKCMDTVLLNQSLQMMQRPHMMLREAARVGRQVIVSVPNFGYWYNRYYLALRGRMPVSRQLNYAWYETPNIHFCTLGDFEELCNALELRILHREIIMSLRLPPWLQHCPKVQNVFGQKGVFVLEAETITPTPTLRSSTAVHGNRVMGCDEIGQAKFSP